MRGHLFFAAIAASIACAVPAGADTALDIDAVVGDGGGGVGGVGGGLGGKASPALPPYLQCVPYARRVSGIGIYGDAHTWWGQAAGHYQRGASPRVGAVMAFAPHGKMLLGHVAAVSKIVDSRTVLLRHANWSLIGGRRGQIEDNVRAIDVSAAEPLQCCRLTSSASRMRGAFRASASMAMRIPGGARPPDITSAAQARGSAR